MGLMVMRLPGKGCISLFGHICPLRVRQDVGGELALTSVLLPGEYNRVREGPESALSMTVESVLGREERVGGEAVEGSGINGV